MLLQPLRIGIRLNNILYRSQVPDGAGAFGWPSYLWTVFFKIDGDTTLVNSSFLLQGTATVVGTLGDHGDLGDGTDTPGNIPIPQQLGEYRTVFRPIPVDNFPHISVGGNIGCLVILFVEDGTPDDAIAQGHNTLNSAIQSQLNALIPTLGIKNPAPTQADIDAMQQRVSDAVTATITDNVSFWDFLGSLGNRDHKVGTKLFKFAYADLVNAVATGIPLESKFELDFSLPAADVVQGNVVNTWDLTGTIYADPYDFSLRRTLSFRHLDPSKGIRGHMALEALFSVRAWIIGTIPTA